jgi:hypothetical protein
MRVIIAGSRTATQPDVDAMMELYPFKDRIIEVVSGGAKGADLAGEDWARRHGIPIQRFIPDWNKFGKSAGHRRNRDMGDSVAQNGPGGLCACWDGVSKGTAGMITYARKLGLRIHIHQFSPVVIQTGPITHL